MNERFWIIPNILSLTRIILTIPISILLLDSSLFSRLFACSIMIIAALTDLLDGYFARKLRQVSEFGKILDPLADKISVGVVCTILAIKGSVSLWFFFIVIVRDVLIFIGGMYLKKSIGVTTQSNQVGKWAVTTLALFLIVSVLDFAELMMVKHVLLFLCLVFLVMSFIFYLQRFLTLIQTHQSTLDSRNGVNGNSKI